MKRKFKIKVIIGNKDKKFIGMIPVRFQLKFEKLDGHVLITDKFFDHSVYIPDDQDDEDVYFNYFINTFMQYIYLSNIRYKIERVQNVDKSMMSLLERIDSIIEAHELKKESGNNRIDYNAIEFRPGFAMA